LNIDERSKLVAYKVIAVMYFLTIAAIQGIVIYRQFVLGQDVHDFEDIAVVMTVNSLFLVSALLYFGAIPIQRLSIKAILSGYGLIVVMGTLFTYLKYNVFQSPGLTMGELFDKLLIIFSVSGLIVLFFTMFYYLGKRKLEKELE
jgi:hypothetical protein